MKPHKKREHVKGAWWYIAATLAFVAWCAQTGRDPGAITGGFVGVWLFLCAVWVLFCAIIAIVGSLLGCGRGE